jgi:exopolysaccharide biosynthesis protein
MTLHELATLMLALGARDAINLDGGGSTTMVVKSPESQSLRVVNMPSDASGERAVGNALAIVRECAARQRTPRPGW